MCFYMIEPFGDDWLQTGQICTAVSATVGAKTKPQAWTPAKRQRQTPSSMLATMQSFAKVHNNGNDR